MTNNATTPDPGPEDDDQGVALTDGPMGYAAGDAGYLPPPGTPTCNGAGTGDPVLRIAINICRPCLDGKGQECHTPGCALWMHKVDLPIDPVLYEVLADPAAATGLTETAQALVDAIDTALSYVEDAAAGQQLQAAAGSFCDALAAATGDLADTARLRRVDAAARAWRSAQRDLDTVLGGRPVDPAAYSAVRPVRDAALAELSAALDQAAAAPAPHQ